MQCQGYFFLSCSGDEVRRATYFTDSEMIEYYQKPRGWNSKPTKTKNCVTNYTGHAKLKNHFLWFILECMAVKTMICNSILKLWHCRNYSGLKKLGFLVNESPCFLNQVQENVVRLAILCSLWRYEVQVFASPCTSVCTKWKRLWKEKCWNKFRYSCIQCFFFLSV